MTSTGHAHRLTQFLRSRVFVVACAAFLVTAASRRIAVVVGRLPYCQHWDEGFLTGHAVNILKALNPNPHFFNYPSLPIYLVALFMRLSQLVAQHPTPIEYWTVPSPGGYYDPAFIYAVPRIAFALFSIATLACIGKIASSLFESPVALLLAPMLLASSRAFQYSSLKYLNVDGPTAMFAACAILVTLLAWEREGSFYKSVLPGVFCGLTIACKYNSGLVLMTPALGILLGSTNRRIERLAVLVACAAAAFVFCVPYSVLDTKQFVRDVLFEIHHYRTGHKNFEAEPGWPQLAYYLGHLWNDLGPVAALLSVAGLAYGILRYPRRTVAVASFPLAMLAHMSTNRAHFVRTVLPVFVLAPVFAAGGIVAAAEIVRRALARSTRPPFVAELAGDPRASMWLQVALALPCLAFVTTDAFLDRNYDPDNRNVASRWLTEHASGADVYFAPETVVAPGAARGTRVHVTTFGMTDLESLLSEARSSTCYVATPTYGGKSGPKVNKRISEALAGRHGEVVFSGEGRHVVAWARNEPKRPTEDPALDLHRVACGPMEAR